MVDIDFPEIALLTLKGVVSLTIILGLIDTALAMAFAVAQGVFNAKYAADFLISHGKIWFSITSLAVLGNGVPALDVPALSACTLAATLGLAAYAVTVIGSLIANSRNSAAPTIQ